MKRKQITLKGWANNLSPDFGKNFDTLKTILLSDGFKELNTVFHNLSGKNATEKITVKAWYWRGEWSDATKESYAVFYK